MVVDGDIVAFQVETRKDQNIKKFIVLPQTWLIKYEDTLLSKISYINNFQRDLFFFIINLLSCINLDLKTIGLFNKGI